MSKELYFYHYVWSDAWGSPFGDGGGFETIQEAKDDFASDRGKWILKGHRYKITPVLERFDPALFFGGGDIISEDDEEFLSGRKILELVWDKDPEHYTEIDIDPEAYLETLTDDIYDADSKRVAKLGCQEEVELYKEIRKGGCCGFHDEVVKYQGVYYMIGWNDGH
jgi:hypothetical protein